MIQGLSQRAFFLPEAKRLVYCNETRKMFRVVAQDGRIIEFAIRRKVLLILFAQSRGAGRLREREFNP
jgi:hypothetical protein